MQTIVINSQKGGSGKTTLCAHLAVQAELSGDGPVFLIDTDPQGTLSTWHEKREAEAPQRADVPLAGLESGLQMLKQHQAEYCIIDTAPTRTDENVALFRLADIVLMPIRPSPSDLWAAAATVALLKEADIPFLFILTQAKANASITGQAAAALSHYGPVAETFIADRVPYAASMTDGRTAIELTGKGPAAIETAALWKNIKTCLHANMLKTEKGKRHG
ncbi:chromosome partitioning protein [Nitrosospira briensis]|uniref:Chromosome partitioning protein n=1 Tax=Nitrosospira briensis TaxID=35799 RepID=A0A1I5FCZ5_9PROT|nr:ParA family protein [Nitrosospira briensis]SFO21602.1 chromosome partitioning protein [Nitrosospira briensis]